MAIDVRKECGYIWVTVSEIHLEAKFSTMDEATEFIQSLISNVTSY